MVEALICHEALLSVTCAERLVRRPADAHVQHDVGGPYTDRHDCAYPITSTVCRYFLDCNHCEVDCLQKHHANDHREEAAHLAVRVTDKPHFPRGVYVLELLEQHVVVVQELHVDPVVRVYHVAVHHQTLKQEDGDVAVGDVHDEPEHHEDVAETHELDHVLEVPPVSPVVIVEAFLAHLPERLLLAQLLRAPGVMHLEDRGPLPDLAFSLDTFCIHLLRRYSLRDVLIGAIDSD